MAARTARQFSVSAPAVLADEIREHSVSPSEAFQRGASQLVAEKVTLAAAGEGAERIRFDVYDRDGDHVEEVVLYGKIIGEFSTDDPGWTAVAAWSAAISRKGKLVVIAHHRDGMTEAYGYDVFDSTRELNGGGYPDDVAEAIESLVTNGHVRRVLDV